MNRRLYYATAVMMFLSGNMIGLGLARGQGGGDQLVDGIDETVLVARYEFKGDANDRSRDGRHATPHGASFVDDKQFGQVLALTGAKDSYLELPSSALADAEAISVVGWVYLNADAANQRFFDFGKSANASFYCTPTGTDAKSGYRARITADGAAKEEVKEIFGAVVLKLLALRKTSSPRP